MDASTYSPQTYGFDDLASYQHFHGIKADGVLGPVTRRSMEAPRFCGLPDNMKAARGGLCRWTKSMPLTWRINESWKNLGDDDVKRAFQIAFDRWEAVANLKFKYTEASKADFTIYSRKIDGPSNVLAEFQLPCGTNNASLWGRFDKDEPWVLADNVQNMYVDLIRVACHEIGHGLGIDHIGTGNLMAPMYSTKINKPQVGDIAEAVSRYGPPVVTPDPDPPGPDIPTDGESILIRVPKTMVVG